MIEFLTGIALWFGAIALIIAFNRGANPKTPKPGKDYDERGPY